LKAARRKDEELIKMRKKTKVKRHDNLPTPQKLLIPVWIGFAIKLMLLMRYHSALYL